MNEKIKKLRSELVEYLKSKNVELNYNEYENFKNRIKKILANTLDYNYEDSKYKSYLYHDLKTLELDLFKIIDNIENANYGITRQTNLILILFNFDCLFDCLHYRKLGFGLHNTITRKNLYPVLKALIRNVIKEIMIEYDIVKNDFNEINKENDKIINF